MKITDPQMQEYMERALRSAGNLHSLEDIAEGLQSGNMQGHVEGKTWVITQVHDWPSRRSVNILYVVGNLEDALMMESNLIKWSKSVGADFISGIARDGWDKFTTPGWKKMGTVYMKEI